ncbi:MAG: hypothetical protein WBN23_16265 [Woeseia sp.]
MSGNRTNRILTIDHANKRQEIGDAELYRHWVRQANELREAREQQCPDHFRRDQTKMLAR